MNRTELICDGVMSLERLTVADGILMTPDYSTKEDVNMRPIAIDAEELISALQNHDGESEYYLDRDTGEILFCADENLIGEAAEELRSLIDGNPHRFLSIDPVRSSTGWQVMADFIEQLPDGEVRETLTRAVQHSKPFRRFKDQLFYYPEVQQDWFAFQYREWLALAQHWLKIEGIKAELKTRENAP